jgi:hypothetical protein
MSKQKKDEKLSNTPLSIREKRGSNQEVGPGLKAARSEREAQLIS